MPKLNPNIHPKLSDTVIKELRRRNVTTVVEFVVEDSEKLANIVGLPYKDILELKQIISEKHGALAKNGYDVLQSELKNIVPTGITCLDDLLKGGLYPGQIYELCGLTSCGKTQLCLTIAANVALRPNSIVRYIDTKRDFSGYRIQKILVAKQCNEQVVDEVMERIQVCCVYSFQKLFKVLEWLPNALKEENEECRTRVIIIDCLPAVIFKFTQETHTMYALNRLANVCRFIAKEFLLTIITVNIITYWHVPGEMDPSGSKSVEDHVIITPALGKYWSRVPNTRLSLSKLDLENRRISVWKSFQLQANLSCTVTISNSGMT